MGDGITGAPVPEGTTKLRASVSAGGRRPTEDIEPSLQNVRDGLGGLGLQPLEEREARLLVHAQQVFFSPKV